MGILRLPLDLSLQPGDVVLQARRRGRAHDVLPLLELLLGLGQLLIERVDLTGRLRRLRLELRPLLLAKLAHARVRLLALSRLVGHARQIDGPKGRAGLLRKGRLGLSDAQAAHEGEQGHGGDHKTDPYR